MALVKVHLYSASLMMQQTCNVILPQRRDAAADRKLPVLWLLHGMFGSYASWMRKSSIERYAARYGLAVVMPNGENSFYADMAHGGRYRTWITEELPQKLRTMFNFSDKREDNYIAGLSMGGMGSFHLGLSCPEKYSVIGALSCPFMDDFAMPGEKYADTVTGGKTLEGTVYDVRHSVEKMLAENKPCPRVFHMCGTEDSLLAGARAARDYLASLPGNPLDYVYREAPGAHNWEFWDLYVQDFLEYIHVPVVEGQYL